MAPAPTTNLAPKVLRKTVNAAPFVNPALGTIMNRPAFVPPGQSEMTTNVVVCWGHTSREDNRLGHFHTLKLYTLLLTGELVVT